MTTLTIKQIQKLSLTGMLLVVLAYGYFSFLLGPLQRSDADARRRIADLEAKLANAESEVQKCARLEDEARFFTARLALIQEQVPQGAPIAWFPPAIKNLFARYDVPVNPVRLVNSAPLRDAHLAGLLRHDWTMEVPQTDYRTLGRVLAALENEHPLLSIRHLRIGPSVADGPEFQAVALNLSTVLRD